MPKVTLSRFFDANVRLVAGVCSRCFLEGDDDVRIVAVNRRFLEQVERRRAFDHCQTDTENGDLKLSTITADDCSTITPDPSPVPQITPPLNDSNNNASLCIAGNFQEPAHRNSDSSFQNVGVKTETLLSKHEPLNLEQSSLEFELSKTSECKLEKIHPDQGFDPIATKHLSIEFELPQTKDCNSEKNHPDQRIDPIKTEHFSVKSPKAKESSLQNIRPDQCSDLMETQQLSLKSESTDTEKYNFDKIHTNQTLEAMKIELPSLESQPPKTECTLKRIRPSQQFDFISPKSESTNTQKFNLNHIHPCQNFAPMETEVALLKPAKCNLKQTHFAPIETLKSEPPKTDKCNLAKLRGYHDNKVEKSPRKPLWNPPRSPHNLIEESLFHDPWSLLVATIFLNKTSCKCARPRVEEFLRDFAGPHDVLGKRPADLEKYFLDLGLFKRRAEQVWRMSYDYVHKDWRSAKELYGIGKYGEDAYRIFVLGDLDVEPTDRFLRIYRDWVRMEKKSATRGCSSGDDD